MKPCYRWALLYALAFAEARGSAPPVVSLSKLPLRFEENRSRTPHKESKYQTHGRGFTLELAPSQSWIESIGWSIRTRWVGGNSNAAMQPEARVAGLSNYFIGAEGNWRTGIAAYGRVRCHDVYPGIDLVYHGEGGQLEYDLVLSPHADPKVIRMELSGHTGVRVDPSGDLLISTPAKDIHFKKPDIYQDTAGVRRPVAGRFVVAGNRIVKFEIGAYDHDHTLVIDPVLNYSTYFGGSGNDVARGIGVDALGNVYIAGQTDSIDLPTVNGVQMNFGGQTASVTHGDGFVAKFSPTGALLYVTYIGGARDEGVAALAVDAAGNAYLTGATTSLDFPVVNAYQSQFAGLGGNLITRTGDAFVTKLNPTGDKILYSTYLGGSMDDIATAIAVDSAGNAYITGGTRSADFPTTLGAFQTRLRGVGGEPIKPCCNAPFWDPGDAFVAKLDPTGSQLLFSTYLGGFQDDIAFSIGLDPSNNVYVGGCTISSDYPVTPGVFQKNFGGIESQNFFLNFGDGFVTKLNPTGTALVYSTFFGGAGDDCVSALAVDASGSVYFTGSTSTINLPTSPGSVQAAYAGYYVLPFLIEQLYGDAFVAKLNPAGTGLSYLTYLGGSLNDAGTGIAIDSSGDAFVVGWSDSTDFPVAGSPFQSKMKGDGGQAKYVGYGDAFLAVVNPTGTALNYSTYLGGTADDEALGVAIDSANRVYVAGHTLSSNFPVSANAAQPSYAGAKTSRITKGDAFYSVFSGFPVTPVISKVANAEGESPTIAPNTWVEIKGAGLATGSRIWQASDFVNNQMPTVLDGTSVSMNGKPAFVYFISSGQINVVTPPDLQPGPVQVVVNNQGQASSAFSTTAQPYSPSFFVINGGPYILATHLDGTVIGPTSLYPGASTPAAAGEEIIVYANGFGPVTPPVVSGSASQNGPLPTLPVVRIGGNNANVRFAGLVGSPAFFQFNVDIPAGAVSGDNSIIATYNGISTQPGTLVTVR